MFRVAGHAQAGHGESSSPDLSDSDDDVAIPEAVVEPEAAPGILDLEHVDMVPGLDGEPEAASVLVDGPQIPEVAKVMEADPIEIVPGFDGVFECVFTHVISYDQATGYVMVEFFL